MRGYDVCMANIVIGRAGGAGQYTLSQNAGSIAKLARELSVKPFVAAAVSLHEAQFTSHRGFFSSGKPCLSGAL